ncbi:MAG: biotin/lipoyl-binding protein [Bilophila wadsworthia]
MLKRIIVILVVLACAAGGIWWLYDGKRQPSDLLTLYGNVDIRQVDVGFRVGGRVTELFKEEGDAVKTGERLARLDAKPYEEVFDQAAAQLSMQEIELRKMVAGYRTEDIEQARATLSGAQAVYANAASNLRRVERLRQQNAVSQQSLDEARASYGDALSRRNAAREQLQLMESGYRSEDVERQKAAVEAARAELARATTNGDTELFARRTAGPDPCTRSARCAGRADRYTVTLNNPVWIRARHAAEPGNIRPGQEVLLSIDATPDKTYRGRIGFISPTAEFTPKTVETKEVRNDLVFRFRVIADDPDNVMRQGMPVTVTLRKDGGKP